MKWDDDVIKAVDRVIDGEIIQKSGKPQAALDLLGLIISGYVEVGGSHGQKSTQIMLYLLSIIQEGLPKCP